MYDWIPIEFDYDILLLFSGTQYERYHCIANGEDRESFTVFKNDHVVLSTFATNISHLELVYRSCLDEEGIDISSLI